MAFKIMMFSDFICPFCYIGFEIVRKLKSELGFELQWRGFQIHPEWPPEGIAAAEFHRATSRQIVQGMREALKSLAAEAGLSMKQPEHLANSRLALEAGEFAADRGAGEAFEERVYRAYFQESVDIGNRDALIGIAAEVGIGTEEINEAWDSGRYALKLKNNALVAHRRGVNGVPTFFIGDFPMVGAQSPDTMRQLITRAAERLAQAQS
jgi:predicted DsbA family dithiol-disulfide isomerase